MKQWYVITGGPCAGKTTLITELAERGYRTVPEAARAHIEQGFSEGKTLAEIRADEGAFQHALIRMKLETEKALPKDKTIFFDRGMHDSIAYLALVGVTDDPLLADAVARSSYKKAFLLDLLPFSTDDVRTETEEEARRVHELLHHSYAEAGIPVVRVPVLPVKERADFVLANL